MTTETEYPPWTWGYHCVLCDGTGAIARPMRDADGREFLRGDLCPRCGGLGRSALTDTEARRIPLAAALRFRAGREGAE